MFFLYKMEKPPERLFAFPKIHSEIQPVRCSALINHPFISVQTGLVTGSPFFAKQTISRRFKNKVPK